MLAASFGPFCGATCAGCLIAFSIHFGHATPQVYEHCVVIAIADASAYIASGLQIMIIRNYKISQGILRGVLHYSLFFLDVFSNTLLYICVIR